MRLKFLLTGLLPLAFSIPALPQTGGDTTFVKTARKNAIAMYEKGIGAQARLYNGSKYVEPDHTFEEHPYYLSIDWINGDVLYDGELFQNVPLMLDLNSGQLITEHYSNGQPIRLVPEKVGYFTMSGHRFQRIDNETVASSLPATTFYEVLYAGKSKVVARRQKLLHEEIDNAVIETTFDERNHYYIFKGGIFHQVKSKGSVLKLFQEQKQNLKRMLRQRKAEFRGNHELLYKSAAEYYDTLTK
jgi:hypothetical protein